MRRSFFLFIFGLVVFAATMLLAILGALRLQSTDGIYTPSAPIELWYFIFAFLLLTALIVLLLRLAHGRLIFIIFFSLAMFVGVWFFADIFFTPHVAIIVAALILALRYIIPRVATQNLLVITGVSGVAVSLGSSLPWLTVLIIALILAVYDIVAVYWTGHMVTMMKGLLARGVIFAAVLPSRPHGSAERLDRVHPREGFALIGTGDLALPATLVASLVATSLGSAIAAAVGALIGFAATIIIFFGADHNRPMPALPPIVLGMVVGFLFSFLL